MTINVVVAGGGTAGHIEPAMNLADYLRDHEQDVAITALGTEKGLVVPVLRDADLLSFAGIEKTIAEYGKRYYGAISYTTA